VIAENLVASSQESGRAED